MHAFLEDMRSAIINAFTLLLTVIITVSCSGHPNETLEAAAKIRVRVQAPPIWHRFRRAEGVIQDVDIQAVLNSHNDYRRKEGSSNMNKLTWNAYMATMASDWAKKCSYVHGQPPRDAKEAPYGGLLGQNIFASGGVDKGLPFTVDQYMAEKEDYDFDKDFCQTNKECGHYKQVVFPTAKEVGCAYTKCDYLDNFRRNSFFYVCNYGPAMEITGGLLYLKGRACSTCPDSQWCDDGLCVENCNGLGKTCHCGSACQHCGTVDGVKCRCNCAEGYMGPDCGANCTEIDNCQHFQMEQCKENEFIRRACPVACGTCKPAHVGTPLRECPIAYGGAFQMSLFSPLSTTLQLLLETLLLLCLQNNS